MIFVFICSILYHKNRIKKDLLIQQVLAGVEGIEPSSGVLETLILPMNYTPMMLIKCSIFPFFSQYLLFIFCRGGNLPPFQEGNSNFSQKGRLIAAPTNNYSSSSTSASGAFDLTLSIPFMQPVI